MERERKAPQYITGVLKAVRSWLTHNEVELKRRVKVRDANATPTIADERVPTKEELRTILIYAGDRCKVSTCLMAQAGLRSESLGNESGTDGLRINDLPAKAMHSPEELGLMPSEFDRLVRSHFDVEEKRIFPWALQTHQGIRKNDPESSV
jgi:hypothetical protein